MRKYIAIFIAICLLTIGYTGNSLAQQKYIPKKKHKQTRLYKFLHKKRERMKKWNAGHTEFKDRTKKDRKRLGRHHLNPYKPTKSDKPNRKMWKYQHNEGGGEKSGGKQDGQKEEKVKEKPEEQQQEKPAEKPAELPSEKPAEKPEQKPEEKPEQKLEGKDK